MGGKRSLTGTSMLFSRTLALPGEFEQPVAQKGAFFGLSHLPVAGCQRGVLCYSLMVGPSNGIADDRPFGLFPPNYRCRGSHPEGTT